MTEANKLHFSFKGSRNYVHGSDIFDALDEWFEKQGMRVLDLAFRGFSSNHLICMLTEPENGVKAEGNAIDKNGNRTAFWVVEAAEPVAERYPFDEEAIAGHAHIEGKTIEADETSGYSVIEQIIALTKALNYALVPEVNGKWVFGQLRLTGVLPKKAARYKIRQKTQLAGRFSVQEITLDDCVIGDIRFITSQS